MGNFNKKYSSKGTNMAGAQGVKLTDAKQEIIGVVVNSMLSGGNFYESNPERMLNIKKLFKQNMNEPLFLLKLMVYTRNEMNLRSVSHVLAVLAVENIKGIQEVKRALQMILVRPDDATEIVALWNHRNTECMIPNALRKAIKHQLENKWDAYRLKKYYGTGAVKVPDLIKLCHPKARDPFHGEMFKQALEGTLPAIETAQTVNAGSTGEDRAENYKAMLKENKLGTMAALKNIKNIVEAKLDTENLDMLGSVLMDPNRVRNSRLLPFRFAQAYMAVHEMMGVDLFVKNAILQMIDAGFSISASNLGFLGVGERVGLLLDESMSMGDYQIGTTDQKAPFFIGKTMIASILTGAERDKAIALLWADSTRTVSIDKSPMQFVIDTKSTGGGTNLAQAIEALIVSNTVLDKIVVFTDMQVNRFSSRVAKYNTVDKMFTEYRNNVNPEAKVIFWNLDGYGGAAPVAFNNGIFEVAGFSDKMLEIIPMLMEDKNALVETVQSVEL